MAGNDFLDLYVKLVREYYETHSPAEEPKEFHLTREDENKLVSVAKLLTKETLEKFLQVGAQETFPKIFGYKAVYGASKTQLK